MGTIKSNLNKVQTDKIALISKYTEAGIPVSGDATFTDLVDNFSNLPIVDITVEGTELVFGNAAEVDDGELIIGDNNE